jgi:diaminohydroxyphosphoribosylaminopyrimidine deaminase/5-amino-6-(5-phosphoribosylamino)uracil reductase
MTTPKCNKLYLFFVSFVKPFSFCVIPIQCEDAPNSKGGDAWQDEEERSPQGVEMTEANLSPSIDSGMMQRCLELARQALGQTSPNPMVGAVVVQNGEIVGEGFHPKAGEPHAEVFALRAAGDRAQGATLYVNLEPCSHYGRTPPCADAVIAAGVRRVVVGMVDPNPKVAGRGIARIQDAGIEVTVGVEEAACRDLNEAFIHAIQHQKPLGILKYAMTLDGKIAAVGGHSAWITRPPARAYVHQLRATCDAVLVGGNTVRRDNPHLTTHGVSDRNPLRVVMSRQLDLPTEAHLWQVETAQTLVLTESGANPPLQEYLLRCGVEVVELATLTPQSAMDFLYRHGCLSVLWECGGVLSARAIAAGVIQKVFAFIAPKIIGGINAPSPVGDLGLTRMTEALLLERVRWQSVGEDLLVEGYMAAQANSAAADTPKT